MLWRIILKYPLGNSQSIMPSLLINIIGAEGFSGNAVYEGLNEVLQIENLYIHIYGKVETRPGRKMGHITLLGHTKEELLNKASKVKNLIKVTA